MTWQEVVGVNRDKGTITLRNADGDEYEVPVLSRIEDLLDEDELHVNINPYPPYWDLPEPSPPIIKAWHSGDWDDVTQDSDDGVSQSA